MCRFKSGIILKNKIKLAEGANDSHSDLLEEMGIMDDYIGASKKFVRAELVPENGEWWVNPEEHPEHWRFTVDQDIVPEWFDKDEHETLFRESVCAWWKEHVLIDRKIDELTSGYYRLKRCEVRKLCKDVQAMLDNSTVQVMFGSSTVQKMYDSSTVQEMYGSSTVREMCDSSTVQEMYGSSTVREMYDSSTVREMCDSSTVQEMHGSSTVQEMHDSSTARSFRNYPEVKIFVPNNPEKFQMIVCKKNEVRRDGDGD